MPEKYQKLATKPRGVANRRAAMNWLWKEGITEGVLYFGDDDNTFDLRLFDEIRSTQKVSMFPVGLVGDFGVSSPIVKDVRYFQLQSKIRTVFLRIQSAVIQ